MFRGKRAMRVFDGGERFRKLEGTFILPAILHYVPLSGHRNNNIVQDSMENPGTDV